MVALKFESKAGQANAWVTPSLQALLSNEQLRTMDFVDHLRRIGLGGGVLQLPQQSWEGEIIKERDTKHGRGRPRKQYLVRWKPSWVDGARLTAPELLQNWKEKKASKGKR